MNPHVSVITLGVRDLPRAKQFYGEGLGWPVEQDYPVWVSFKMGEGSSTVGLYPWEALAGDAGVAPEGTGFRGVTLSYIVRSEERVAEVMAEVALKNPLVDHVTIGVKKRPPVQGLEWAGVQITRGRDDVR